MISIIALWVLVLVETGLLLLLLRALGELKQQGKLLATQTPSFEMGGLDVGEQAPSFVAIDDDGTPVNLEDFSGRRRVLAFVSPGCPACGGAIEALNAVVREERDLVVLVLGGPDRERNRAYAAEHKAQMPIHTPTADVKQAYRVQGVPFVFILDEAGLIRAKGPVNATEHVQNLLRTAFVQPSVVH